MGPLFFFFITCWASMSSPSGISFLFLLIFRAREKKKEKRPRQWIKEGLPADPHAVGPTTSIAAISSLPPFLFSFQEKRGRKRIAAIKVVPDGRSFFSFLLKRRKKRTDPEVNSLVH